VVLTPDSPRARKPSRCHDMSGFVLWPCRLTQIKPAPCPELADVARLPGSIYNGKGALTFLSTVVPSLYSQRFNLGTFASPLLRTNPSFAHSLRLNLQLHLPLSSKCVSQLSSLPSFWLAVSDFFRLHLEGGS
jgi:hypothetical protein